MGMREEFEAWECDSDDGPQTDPKWLMRNSDNLEEYGIIEVQHNWRVWQASRAALVIELPYWGDAPAWSDEAAHNQTCDECADVIRATGVICP